MASGRKSVLIYFACGISYGSVLGLLLFIIYSIDLLTKEMEIVSYTDDSSMIRIVECPVTRVAVL